MWNLSSGGGALFFAKPPSIHEVLNDVDGAVVAFWRTMRDQFPDLERACALTPYSRQEWAAADLAEPGLDDLELARRFWVKVCQSYGHSLTAGFVYSTGQNTGRARTVLNTLDRFGPAAARLAGAMIEQQDALMIVRRFGTADALVYLDPPYEDEARVSADDYRHEMGVDDHRALAEAAHEVPAAVIVSGYAGPLYDSLYGDWHRVEFDARHTDRVEVVWSNRTLTPSAGSLFG